MLSAVPRSPAPMAIMPAGPRDRTVPPMGMFPFSVPVNQAAAMPAIDRPPAYYYEYEWA